jgi:hypothetical protein
MDDIPADIESRISSDFPEEDRVSALDVIRSLAAQIDREVPRILRCVLFLSRGELPLLAYNAEQARLDYRDVIYWAEYDEQDRQVRDFNQPF